MPPAATAVLALLAAYLLGSVPFAVVVSRVFGLADPRSYGSGNPGATNVLRTGNKKAAILTLAGDALKGWVAVFAAQQMGLSALLVGLVALAVFFGHLFPVFLKFKGGKGVATAAGVLLALDPLIGLAVLGTWLFMAFAFRYSSLAAVAAAALAPVYVGLARPVDASIVIVGILSLALIGKHWQNIQRLLAGQETKIGSKKKG
ncbi:MAG: plsY [Rhodocyclaceae bacterium]|nr:plsY [Rhodocyclaceae bacterium]